MTWKLLTITKKLFENSYFLFLNHESTRKYTNNLIITQIFVLICVERVVKFLKFSSFQTASKENNMSYVTPIHPGMILQDELEELGISQSALATHIGVLPKTINEICNGKRGISAATAWKLSKAIGASPLFWMNLQTNWELSQIDETAFKKLEKIAA